MRKKELGKRLDKIGERLEGHEARLDMGGKVAAVLTDHGNRLESHFARLTAIEKRLDRTTPAAGGHMLHQRLQRLEDWRDGVDGALDPDVVRKALAQLRDLPNAVTRHHERQEQQEGQLIELHRQLRELQNLRERYETNSSPLLSGTAIRLIEDMRTRVDALERGVRPPSTHTIIEPIPADLSPAAAQEQWTQGAGMGLEFTETARRVFDFRPDPLEEKEGR